MRQKPADGVGVGGEFGRGWRLLIPYRIKPAGQATRRFKGVVVPERMFVENQVTGVQELLNFSKDRYSVIGYVPVAEGVDNEGIVEALIGLGCDTLQGFHFSEPLPAAQFERWHSEYGEWLH